MLLRLLSLTMANTFEDDFWDDLNSGHKIPSAAGKEGSSFGH